MVVSAIIALDIAIVVSSWDVKNFGNKRTTPNWELPTLQRHTLKKRPRLQYIKIQLIQFPLHQGTEVSFWP